MGFPRARGPECLRNIDAIARDRRQSILMMRGNHDDPAIWMERRVGWNERFDEMIEGIRYRGLVELEAWQLGAPA